ncbi:LOW QUALITY PROTEIN: taste receptor type 2 member 42-like [Glossophaga mutica]
MSAGMKVTFLVVAAGELILGMLGNGFTGLVTCIYWVKNGKISSANVILTSLAMARIIELWVTLVDSFTMELAPHLCGTGELAKVVTILWALTNHLTTCLATNLSIFYFLKLLMQDALSELWMNTYRVHERNMTLPLNVNKMFYLKSLLLSLTYVIPFLLSLSPLLLLFLSLVRHTKNLQLNLMGSRDSGTEAHRRAMKLVTTFLLLFIISTPTASWSFIQVKLFFQASPEAETDTAKYHKVMEKEGFPSALSFEDVPERGCSAAAGVRLGRHLHVVQNQLRKCGLLLLLRRHTHKQKFSQVNCEEPNITGRNVKQSSAPGVRTRQAQLRPSTQTVYSSSQRPQEACHGCPIFY